MARTPFTVGSGDMDGFELMMGITEELHQLDRIGDIFLVSSTSDSGKHGKLCKEVLDGFFVIHGGNSGRK